MINEVLLAVPRHAASPRQVARPAEVWRLCQEAVVQASAQQGWPPERYHQSGCSFVLASMVTHHRREVGVGEPLCARTWVRAFRRQTLCDREVELATPAGEVVVRASQRWAHVQVQASPAAAALHLSRAPAALIEAFPLHSPPDAAPPIILPSLPEASGIPWEFSFRCWQSWLDPLRHVNHPTYLEWCDENMMQRLAAQGVPPERLQPVAEQVLYRHSVEGNDPVVVRSVLVGASADGTTAALQHTIAHPDSGQVFAVATTVRRLAGGAALAPLLGGVSYSSSWPSGA